MHSVHFSAFLCVTLGARHFQQERETVVCYNVIYVTSH